MISSPYSGDYFARYFLEQDIFVSPIFVLIFPCDSLW